MHNFHVLDPHQQIVGPHFLEASAGTGKTFAIEHIVVRLFLESAEEIKPQEILVVTFTRAATRELKQRIRQCLQKTLEQLENKKIDIPYLQPFMVEELVRDAVIKKLQEVLSSFDQMQIFTIHGFCHHMLKTYAFEAGLGIQERALEDLSYQEIQKEQIVDFLRSELKAKKFHRHQIHKVLKKCHHDVHRLVDKILALVNKDATLPSFPGYEELLERFKKVLKSHQVENCVEQFLALAPLFKGISSIKKEPHAHFLRQAHILAECLHNEQGAVQVFDELISLDEWFLECLTEGSLKKGVKIPFHQLRKEYTLLALKEDLLAVLLEATDETKIFLRLAQHCKERIQRALIYHGVTPPDDVLKLMHKSLQSTQFCKRVQERYKAAIIDEFQDTDPVQWDITYQLFVLNRPSFPLYLVGDPKQSIYAFRNADLPTYLKAAGEFSTEQRYSLNVNYRSEPLLIAALNQLCLASSKWLSDDETLKYTEVEANPKTKNTDFQDDYGPVHFFVAEQEITREKRIPSKQVEEQYLFPFIAREIAKLHQHKIGFNSCAVLIRDRFQGERLEAYLKNMNIPCVTTSVVNLVDTMAFNFLKMIVNMLDRIEDISSIKWVLAHPFMGFSHEELNRECAHAKTLHAMNALKALGTLYFEQGFLRFWDMLLQTSFHDHKLSFEQRLVCDDVQHYEDLNQLVEILAQKHQYGKLSHEELMYLLERLQEMDPEVHEYIKRRASSEEDAVTIMTMHKSKGLEFEIVFALGVCVRSSFQEEVIKHQNELLILDEDDAMHQAILKQAEKEKLRQLYVALTRAKKRVYIPFCYTEQEGNAPIELFMHELFRSKGKTISSKKQLLSAIESLKIEGVTWSDLHEEDLSIHLEELEESIELTPPLSYTKSFQGWYSSSYSKLAQEAHVFEPSSRILETPLLPASAETGRVLHKILEKIFERGCYLEVDKDYIQQLTTQETSCSHLAGFEEPIQTLIHQVLQIQFQDGENTFSFQDVPPSQLVTEMEFLLEDSPTQVFKGFIDLMFQYRGKYYLVDWKSNFLGSNPEDYTKESLHRCMEQHQYFLQADLYTQAITTYLKQLGKTKECYGGIFYVFLRGIEKEGQGVYFIPTEAKQI